MHALALDLHAALGLARGREATAHDRPTALVWLPLMGLALGAVATLVAVTIGHWSPLVGGAAGLGVLRWLRGARAELPALGLLGLEALALVPQQSGVQGLALLLAPLAGGWSQVVQCHAGRGPGVVRGAGFREFGWASVITIGGALVALDAIGLVAVLAAAIPTLALRLAYHRRTGGMPASGPVWSGRVAEASVIVVLALLGGGG